MDQQPIRLEHVPERLAVKEEPKADACHARLHGHRLDAGAFVGLRHLPRRGQNVEAEQDASREHRRPKGCAVARTREVGLSGE